MVVNLKGIYELMRCELGQQNELQQGWTADAGEALTNAAKA